MRRLVAIVGVGALLAACGGASTQYAEPPASPASAPAAAGYPESEKSAAPAGGASPTSPAAMSPAPPSPAPSQAAPETAARDEAATRSTAREGMRELEAAERDVASSDCTTACRALGSMERAVVFICMASQGDDDASRCQGARGRLVGARRKVRSSCGSCPGGPSVDPDAPVPSRK